MILGMLILSLVLFFVFLVIAAGTDSESMFMLSAISAVLSFVLLIVGIFNGFINYPPTERNASRSCNCC